MAESFVMGEMEVVSWFTPDLPLLEKPATNLGAEAGVEPGKTEAVGKVALGSEFSGGTGKLVVNDWVSTLLGLLNPTGAGVCDLADVAEEGA